jgi:predicted amidohydrolase YtcJ
VLSEDILACSEAAIERMEVVMTMVGGRVVHRKM